MSKTKTIIAGLGVTAALGVAALPALTFASEEVTGNVDLYVVIPEAIAMTITGNNDGNSIAGSGNGAIDVFSPSSATGDLDGHTLPETSTTVASSSAWKLNQNSVKEGGDFASTVTIYTNAASGYTLTVKDADANNALVAGENSIPAIADGETKLEAGTSAWGYRVGTTGDWLAMPISTGTAGTIGTENTNTTDGTEYTVQYGVATASDQAAGTYTDQIVYTATTK